MPQKLRPYQEEAFQACRDYLRKEIYKILVVVPTGGGKTTISSHIIHSAISKGSRALFLAHRKELIEQCSKRLDDEGIDHGIIKAGNKRYYPLMPVQVGSVQTLHRRKHQRPEADLIIVDEAHHIKGATYLNLLADYPDAIIIGLTATPFRTDGQGLGDVFSVMVNPVSLQELTDMGFLVPTRVFSTPLEPEFKTVKVRSGEFDNEEVDKIVNTNAIVGDIYEHWKTHAADRQTVIFANSRAHAQHICGLFREHGVGIAYLDANTPNDEREFVLSRLANRGLQIVVNMGILTEGWDCPIVSCVILARPTKSCGLYLQMAGRALRPADGKSDCVILDHGGNTRRFGFVTDDREYSLDGKAITEKEVNVKTCRECFAQFRGASCPACGNVAPVAVRQELPETEAGNLVELDPAAAKKAMHEALTHWLDQGRIMGKPDSWANWMFKQKYGHYPPRGVGPKKIWQQEVDENGALKFKFKGFAEEKYG